MKTNEFYGRTEEQAAGILSGSPINHHRHVEQIEFD